MYILFFNLWGVYKNTILKNFIKNKRVNKLKEEVAVNLKTY